MNVLLVEPDYKNKYPPLGLMKISTYHKNRNDQVRFCKGNISSAEFIKLGIERVYITTLFTFYYKKVLETIAYYQKLIDIDQIYVGGIMVTLLEEELRKDTSINNLMTGLLKDSSVLGLGDSVNIDELPLDYSILDEIEYTYPAGDNYFTYVTRGCPNKCKFCAVPILEPNFEVTNQVVNQICRVNDLYGEKRNILLLDNNIFNLNVDELENLILDLQNVGFTKEPTFLPMNPYELYIKKRNNSRLSMRFQNSAIEYIQRCGSRLKKQCDIVDFKILNNELSLSTLEDRDSVLLYNKDKIDYLLQKTTQKRKLKRYIDFNQGLEAARITPEKMSILAQLPLNPVRIAFDHYTSGAVKNYKKAISTSHTCGVTNFSNYILFNYDDKPEDLWYRLKINIDLAKEKGIRIFSFPMRFAPINQKDRNFIGEYWNKKYLQAISAILLVTKGIVAQGGDFFDRAFGKTIEEYFEILAMPRDFIIYRSFYEQKGLTQQWKKEFSLLGEKEKETLISILSESYNNEDVPLQVDRVLLYYSDEYKYKRITNS